jgi:2-oxoglutarate dehydrogenase complex dehydrogenase (E1) component-like enzyme
MRCPECGDKEAYVGLQWVHCPNEDCKFFDARYFESKKTRKFTKAEKLRFLRELMESDDD